MRSMLWPGRWICILVAALAMTAAFAQTPQRVDKADDLPRFSYAVEGDLEALVRDPKRFSVLAQQVRRDTESVLAGYDIAERATVGAVDKAGDEASFTSYGPTVLLHANGYQVESFVPSGRRIAFSGTSMAAPQVTNLAAKMLAVKPSLKPAQVIEIMRSTADRSEDGRRTLIHPARALAAVGYTQ